MKLRALLCLAVAAASLSVAVAQTAFDRYVADIRILQDQRIQKELGITAAQKSRMNKAADAHRSELQKIDAAFRKEAEAAQKAKKPWRPDMTRLNPANARLKAAVLKELTAKQIVRLRELSLQVAGPSALMDSQVAKQTGLSDAQVKRLRDTFTAGARQAQQLERSTAEPIFKPYQNRKPKDEAEAKKWQQEINTKLQAAMKRVRPQMERIQRETRTKMEAILTAAQRSKFKSLQGKPFNA